MKIFIDSANIAQIAHAAEQCVIDGVTTNPSHLAKEKADPTEQVRELCALLPNGSIHVEITEKSVAAAYTQAISIGALAKNVVVKVPAHPHYFPVIKKLVAQGIAVNVTLLFSLMQAIVVCRIGVAYVSPFMGRLEELGVDASRFLLDLRTLIDYGGYHTQLLAASIRSTEHIAEAVRAGSDVITIAPSLLQKSLDHLLTERGMRLFDEDWQKKGTFSFPA